MPVRHSFMIALLATTWLSGQTPLPAQLFKRPDKGPALTKPPTDDPNFALMGEFIGEIDSGEQGTQRLGLQIRHVGGDEFDALSFIGGLPGQDEHQDQPMRMIGLRSKDFVVLSGGPWAIFVEADSCMILDRRGEKIGRLERIKRTSPTLGARPPEESVVLFDGDGVEQFMPGKMTDDGLLEEGALVKPMFQDFNLHLEFRLPYMPEAGDQARGNSGVYLQSRYECQILDSFAQAAVFNGCGALYKFRAPDVNMCLPPLVWQTYDIQFTAPRWAADGTKLRDAHITSWLNGVKVHDNVAVPNKTGAGKEEAPTLLPIRLQDHGDPVRFRNVWVIDRGLASGEFPVYPTPEQILEDAKAEEERAKLIAAEAEAAAAKSSEPDNEQPTTDPAEPEQSPEQAGEEKQAVTAGETDE